MQESSAAVTKNEDTCGIRFSIDAVVRDGYSGTQPIPPRRMLMRLTLLFLAVLFIVPHVEAAPVPDSGRAAKTKLEELKKRLPPILDEWLKERTPNFIHANDTCYKQEVRVLRRVGPERAKAVILLAAADREDRRQTGRDVLLTIYLSYQDGCWTTEQFEANSQGIDMRPFRDVFAFLMLAIDEAVEK
jgi:hypothetical protein